MFKKLSRGAWLNKLKKKKLVLIQNSFTMRPDKNINRCVGITRPRKKNILVMNDILFGFEIIKIFSRIAYFIF